MSARARVGCTGASVAPRAPRLTGAAPHRSLSTRFAHTSGFASGAAPLARCTRTRTLISGLLSIVAPPCAIAAAGGGEPPARAA